MSRYSVTLAGETDFAGWRDATRRLVLNDVPPHDVVWQTEASTDLFGASGAPLPPAPEGKTLNVSREFMDSAEGVICHGDPARFALLYRLLYRQRSEPHLLKIASDLDVTALRDMAKSVRRDIHKMRAFVRFVRIGEGDEERYVSWFEPDHYIVERNAPFFIRLFTGMRWTIFTPHASADWDGEKLAIGPGAMRNDVPREDTSNTLWRTYFSSIFNPARLKVKAMQAEMPKKYWKNLPEASLIPELIKGADAAARKMLETMPTLPAPHHAKIQERIWNKPEEQLPEIASNLSELRAQASACQRCPLHRDATQTVCGEGPADARVVFVGEQPGDHEDLAGRPFVGPAGRVFDEVIEEAGIEREKLYVTNAVKHFKFTPRGKRRLHQRPNVGEISACRWWVEQELSMVKPNLVVAMGATAAHSLLGQAIPVTQMRGQVVTRDDGLRVFLTIHPSFILRIQDQGEAKAERARFLTDMCAVAELAAVA